MEIQVFNDIEMSEYKNILPRERYVWLYFAKESLDRIVTFCAFVDDVLVGSCITVSYVASHKAAVILYVKVHEVFRNEGVGTELIKAAEEQYRAWGYNGLNVSILKYEKDCIFKKCGYSICRVETNMRYSGAVLKDSKIGINIEKFMPYMDRVCSIDELLNIERNRFGRDVISRIYGIEISKVDKRLARFYLNKEDEVMAYMAFAVNKNKDYVMTDIYLKNEKEATMAIPSILSDILYKKDFKIEDDTSIILSFEARNSVIAMINGFGRPDIMVDSTMLNIEWQE